MAINDNPPNMAGWSDLDGFGPNNERMHIYPVNTVSNYLTTGSVKVLKKRITVRKFDEDGNVTEEVVTEEYGDDTTFIPYTPDPNPWIAPPAPTYPAPIYCGTSTA